MARVSANAAVRRADAHQLHDDERPVATGVDAALVLVEPSVVGTTDTCSPVSTPSGDGSAGTPQSQMCSSVAACAASAGEAENIPVQEPRSRLLGQLLTDKSENVATMLLECAYTYRALLYASAALLDEHDSYWKTGVVEKGGVKALNICAGALCSVPSLEQAILCGMRHIHRLGGRSGGGHDHIVKFEMDQRARKTKVNATYMFRDRALHLAIREERGACCIVAYVMP